MFEPSTSDVWSSSWFSFFWGGRWWGGWKVRMVSGFLDEKLEASWKYFGLFKYFLSYCWWKQKVRLTSWYGESTVIYRVLYISSGSAGFLPSKVKQGERPLRVKLRGECLNSPLLGPVRWGAKGGNLDVWWVIGLMVSGEKSSYPVELGSLSMFSYPMIFTMGFICIQGNILYWVSSVWYEVRVL